MNILGSTWAFKARHQHRLSTQQHSSMQQLVRTSMLRCLEVAEKKTDIDNFLAKIKLEGMEFNIENDTSGFLGMATKCDLDNTLISLKQTRLIDQIIDGLDLRGATSCRIPAEVAPLRKDLDRDLGNTLFNHLNVIGIMLYLSSHSPSNIQFMVLQCARFSNNPTLLYEKTLKCIGRYLKSTRDKGLAISGSKKFNIYRYDDLDFAGMWASKHPNDPDCTISHTGYTITVFSCPIIWSSKQQKEQVSSTIEAEYISLSTAVNDLLPFQ
eukprot:5083760-Ditylum_brightwellii.AAC.1